MEKINYILQNKILSIINFYFKYAFITMLEVNKDDPIFHPINNYKDFHEILINKDKNYFTLLFNYNNDNIHRVLFEDNSAIIFKSAFESFFYLFYLALLLLIEKENIKYHEYKYEYDLIHNTNLFKKKENKNIKKLLLSKDIFDFIGKYDFITNKIKNIRAINENILEDNFFSLGQIELKIKNEKIKFINIDELYIKIKNKLLKFLDNIESKLDLESIDIIKKTFVELCYNMANKNYFNLKKNNFGIEQTRFYFLFEHIFRNLYYIYNNIEFFKKLRSNNIKGIKFALEYIFGDEIQRKIFYIVNNHSNYYLCRYYIKNYNNNSNVNSYFDSNHEKKKNSKIKLKVKTKKSSSTNNSSSFYSLNNLASINYEGNQDNKELFSYENGKKENIVYNIFNSNQNNIFNKKALDHNILEFIKIMGTHESRENAKNIFNNSYAIKEINKGLFISFGSNSLILYNQYFNIIGKICLDFFINNIYEIYDKVNSKIMIFSDNGPYIIKLYLYSLKYSIQGLSIPKKKYDLCLEVSKDDYYFFGLERKYHYINLFNNKNKKRWKVNLKCTYKGGIIINENLILLTSNRVYPKGEDKLIIYNINRRKIIYKITGYSFIFGNNGISSIKVENTNNVVVFCACKKYFSNQKNGILAIYLDIKEEKVKSKLFYKTKNFEVYCFCPILKIENNANLMGGIDDINNSENVISKKTDFIFVGGFNKAKQEGLIKLFKVNYEMDYNNINIEFIQDIYIDKKENNYSLISNKEEKNEIFLGFKGPITCIIQSEKTGFILVSCWDRNVYLFTPPNFNLFIKNKEENYNFINSLIDDKNSYKSNKVEEYSSISYFRDNAIQSSSIGRKFSYENSSSSKNYCNFNLIDYYLFEDNEIDIKQIITKSSIKIYSKNDKEKIICKYDAIHYGDNSKISYNKLKKFQEFPNNIIYGKNKLFLTFIDFMKFLEYVLINIQNYYINKFKLEIKLEFQCHKKERKNKDTKIRCNYYFFVPTNKEYVIIFQDDNIFNNDFKGFKFLLKEINNIIYKNLEFDEIQRNRNVYNESQSYSISSFSNKDSNYNEVPFIDENLPNISEISSFSNSSDNKVIIKMLPKKSSKKHIIDYINIIGRHQNGANSIYILSNNIIISFGINYEISIYDELCNKIMELKIWKLEFNYDVTIFERTNKDIDIIIFNKNKLIIIPINIENKTSYFKKYESHKISISFYLEICSKWKESTYCTGYKLESLFEYIQNNLLEYEKKYNNDILSKYQKGIILNKNLFIFTYNGRNFDDNNLIFYNKALQELDYINKGYSFSKYPNGLYSISREDNNKIIVLWACVHKYQNSLENGIMMININLEYNQRNRYCCFYNTTNFRAYCFCTLLNTDNSNICENKVEYFFVGGYDTKKKQGKIKLYQIIYNNIDFEFSKIKYLKDITFEDIYLNKKQNMNIEGQYESLKGFNSPITCITQDKLNRYILITCHNGSVYLFSPPNLDHYIKNNNLYNN